MRKAAQKPKKRAIGQRLKQYWQLIVEPTITGNQQPSPPSHYFHQRSGPLRALRNADTAMLALLPSRSLAAYCLASSHNAGFSVRHRFPRFPHIARRRSACLGLELPLPLAPSARQSVASVFYLRASKFSRKRHQ